MKTRIVIVMLACLIAYFGVQAKQQDGKSLSCKPLPRKTENNMFTDNELFYGIDFLVVLLAVLCVVPTTRRTTRKKHKNRDNDLSRVLLRPCGASPGLKAKNTERKTPVKTRIAIALLACLIASFGAQANDKSKTQFPDALKAEINARGDYLHPNRYPPKFWTHYRLEVQVKQADGKAFRYFYHHEMTKRPAGTIVAFGLMVKSYPEDQEFIFGKRSKPRWTDQDSYHRYVAANGYP